MVKIYYIQYHLLSLSSLRMG